ncbi:MAG: hypothetical protein Q8N30_12920 [Methylococcales bacterium]|nr:hypothetical protein [Methylococcales bacterium]
MDLYWQTFGRVTHPAYFRFGVLGSLPDQGYFTPTIPKLIAILQGERDAGLADDNALDFISAAELLLLLEQLN